MNEAVTVTRLEEYHDDGQSGLSIGQSKHNRESAGFFRANAPVELKNKLCKLLRSIPRHQLWLEDSQFCGDVELEQAWPVERSGTP